jgi:hypothetical protein
MIDVCAVIEQETGQKVIGETPLDELNVDSLEFLDLLIVLGVPNDGVFYTVGDLMKAVA